MTSPRALTWIERLAWILIYGGLFALVVGLAATKYDAATAWSLIVAGSVVAIAGAVLIWVRSRLR